MEMRKCRIVVLVTALLVAGAIPAVAWGPGAHAVIGVEVAREMGLPAPTKYVLLQGVYGSGAPDFAYYAADESVIGSLAAATHDDPAYLEPWLLAAPWSASQQVFAYGWLTHNQEWGSDYFAHRGDPFVGTWPAPGPGYVVERASALAADEGIPVDVAHDCIEAAVDLLLDQQFPRLRLGGVLRQAASRRSASVPTLLADCYADVPGVNRLMIRALETEYRAGLSVYGAALSLPTGEDDAAFAAGIAAIHGLTPMKAATCLSAAKVLCQDSNAHYEDALEATVVLVAEGPWPN